MEEVKVHVSEFEGPLDLLLQLIQKNKINIYDIPISQIVQQYLEAIRQMKENQMDVAAEFITMAAQLVYIKSKMLLPVYEEEQEDPRAQLVEMLLEYQRYKEISGYFHDRTEIGKNMFVRAPTVWEPDGAYQYRHTPDDLVRAAKVLLSKAEHRMPPPVSSFSGIVGKEKVPVEDVIPHILQRFLEEETVSFLSLFQRAGSRSELVAIFLAVLELCKGNRLCICQETDDDIFLCLGEVRVLEE